MLKPDRARPRASAAIAVALSLLVSACASTSEPQPPCCYVGEVRLGHVQDVYLALDDGSRLAFTEAFPGYSAQSGFFNTAFPFNRVDISRITYAALLPVLPQYDANGDGRLEQPELTVLYIREAALGLGHDVRYVGTNERVDALVLPTGEIGGLVKYVNSRLEQMTPSARNVFQKLKLVGRDLRRKGSENDGQQDRRILPN